MPFLRVCLQERTRHRYFTRDCKRTDRWGWDEDWGGQRRTTARQ